jgi:hypothetical protein
MKIAQQETFSKLDDREQARVLARFGWELTQLGREAYGAEPPGVAHPEILRRLNEIQHRVTAAIYDRLSGESERYPDDVLLEIIAGEGSNDNLSLALRDCFQRTCDFVIGSRAEDGEGGEVHP